MSGLRPSRRIDEEEPLHYGPIIGVLKEHEAGVSPLERARMHGVSRDTIYRWKAKYGAMEVTEARRLKSLRTRIVA
jgi:DNA invertase Pin-like site-specific DNA recombinase